MHDHQLDATHCIFLGFAEGGGVVEGCCCPCPDGIVCVAIRYNQEVEDVDEPCECHCHFEEDWWTDEDEQPTIGTPEEAYAVELSLSDAEIERLREDVD